MPHLRMPQAVRGIVLGQFRQIEPGRKMIADAMNDDGADAFGDIQEAILDRENDAVVQRIALGRAVEPHRQHRACGLDPEQCGRFRGRDGCCVSHGFYYVLCRIVMFYNY